MNTQEVVGRLKAACQLSEHFLEELSGRWDLYGPIWLAISLPVAMFVSSSLSILLSAHPNEQHDLSRLSVGMMEMMVYGVLSTGACWGVLRWRGVESIRLSEIVALLGYSLACLLPFLVVAIIPIGVLQWLAILAGTVASGAFIVRNLWPALRASSLPREHGLTLLAALLAAQFMFLILLHHSFYQHVHSA